MGNIISRHGVTTVNSPAIFFLRELGRLILTRTFTKFGLKTAEPAYAALNNISRLVEDIVTRLLNQKVSKG